MEAKKYPKPLIIMHWLTVLLLIVEAGVGLYMETLEFNEQNFNVYRLHAFTGVFILIITLFRFSYKVRHLQDLPEIEYYSKGHEKLVKAVHGLMYLLLIIIPVVGLYSIYTIGGLQYDLGGPFPSQEPPHNLVEIHENLVILLGILVLMHVGGVIMYAKKTGENPLRKICLLMK